MTQTLTGLFDSYDDAKRAVKDIEAAGVPHHDVSIVGNNARGEHAAVNETGEVAGKGAGIGAALGGAGGLLAGLGLLAIPGLGPVVAAGWLAATAAGAVGGAAIGAAAGGIVGALVQAGVPEDDANVYAEGVRRGGALVTVKIDETLVTAVRTILVDDRAVDLAARRDAYRQEGWTRFDETAPAYDASQIAADRSRYDRA